MKSEVQRMADLLGPEEVETLIRRRFAGRKREPGVGGVTAAGLALPENVVVWLDGDGCDVAVVAGGIRVCRGGLKVGTRKGSRQGFLQGSPLRERLWEAGYGIGARFRFLPDGDGFRGEAI